MNSVLKASSSFLFMLTAESTQAFFSLSLQLQVAKFPLIHFCPNFPNPQAAISNKSIWQNLLKLISVEDLISYIKLPTTLAIYSDLSAL